MTRNNVTSAGMSAARSQTILIIDDDQDSSDALAAFLRKAGHDVRCAGNGREALAALSAIASTTNR